MLCSTSRFDPPISKGPRLLPSPFPLGTRGPLPRTARQEVKWRSLNAETACEYGYASGRPWYPVLLYSRYSVGTVADCSATFPTCRSSAVRLGGGDSGGCKSGSEKGVVSDRHQLNMYASGNFGARLMACRES